jgi:two-component system cell cycle response regulator
MARILVIEDNPTNLELMNYLLRAFAHEVSTAVDGEAGLECIRRAPPELVICDVQLPKVDGFGVAACLKGHPALRTIPLIAVTALAMVGDRDKLLAAGFDGYISKPIDPEKFVSEVEAYLGSNPAKIHLHSKPAQDSAAPRSGKTVLVVDNSAVNLSLAQSILGPFGFHVVITHSADEGLQTARRIRPDLIMSDVHMPDKDGFDFIRAVKTDPQLSRVPFVFISSTVWGDADRKTGLALGAAKFIERPIDPEDLVREINDCFNGTH